jgi:hypothetical protein
MYNVWAGSRPIASLKIKGLRAFVAAAPTVLARAKNA